MSATGDDLKGDIHMLATIKYKPGTLSTVLPFVKAIQDEAAGDPNCLRYEILVYEPTDSLVVVESYKSKAAIDAYVLPYIVCETPTQDVQTYRRSSAHKVLGGM
ncbi:hypothetical protein DACRYDRAFT_111390 [Dacryopinax primogenitus]|uniref:ABM domain-containing protein n=1 Tax=Dacryopinax primogenitus (strain DJM 731) TaxID=1858805 RepID=M5G283_DACPD|nr:uncharacterized protein DACRYDRAFT_111390 [Dacryopinax primogenitus]EJT97872.1 hypothetical protein DACRYDRAFT_111390 [Dacryopinax primogenitus]